MDITAFIRELLFSHDCVIVPDFGGFIGNYTPARVDKVTSTFFPPVKQISFNRNLNHNDGLLAGRISLSAGVNYGDARNLIGEFVKGLRKKLEGGEKVTFDNIGSFTVNQEGNIQFEPDRTVNYHLDSYGLESFQYQPLEGYDVRKRISRNIDREPLKRQSVRKILWSAAVIIPLLGIMTVIPFKTNLFRPKVETSNLNPLANAEFESNKKAVDEKIVTETLTNPENNSQTEQDAKAPVIQPDAINSAGSAAAGSYSLITGSFRLRENAESHAAMLRKEGFEAEILDAPNGFFRVSALRCPDLNSALDKKDSLEEKFPGTWIKKL